MAPVPPVDGKEDVELLTLAWHRPAVVGAVTLVAVVVDLLQPARVATASETVKARHPTIGAAWSIAQRRPAQLRLFSQVQPRNLPARGDFLKRISYSVTHRTVSLFFRHA